MSNRMARRGFLGLTAVGLGFPKLLAIPVADAPQLAAGEPGDRVKKGMWDYRANPVRVENPGLQETWNVGAGFAFDGYGGSLRPDSIAHCWAQPGVPSEEKPFFCTIDYGVPVAISKFVHYFYTPGVKDYRVDPLLLSTAFVAVNIYRSDDGVVWKLADRLEDLPADWPQILTLSLPTAARYYKIEITGLALGARGVRTYEIESFTGPALYIDNPRRDSAKLKAGEICHLQGSIVGVKNLRAFNVSVAASDVVDPEKGPARANTKGRFVVAFRPMQPGMVPVVVELRDENDEVVDQRTVSLPVVPRVVVTDVKADGDAITGRLLNKAMTGILVEVGSGKRSLRLDRLEPGKDSQFRLQGLGRGGGRRIVDLWVREDERVTSRWAFSIERAPLAQNGRLHNREIDIRWETEGNKIRFWLKPTGSQKAIRSTVEITVDETSVPFSTSVVEADGVVLCGALNHGSLECTLRPSGSGMKAVFRSVRDGLQGKEDSVVLGLRLKAEGVQFRFMPAYVYSKKPVSTMAGAYGNEPLVRGGWFPPTRMVAMETTEGTVCLVPDRDRCLMGIEQNDAVVKTRQIAETLEVKVLATPGDWFDSFRYVVTRIHRFEEPRQFKPLIEAISGEAYYLAHNEDIWSQKMQVVTSFPKEDYVYNFYGLTYTIPALYSWYQMSGDRQALERARKCVQWLLDYPGERIKEGPTAGAFFSQYVSPEISRWKMGNFEVPLKGVGGCDQANNRWLEPHATGAATWTLLHYYVADGKQDPAALEAAKAGLDWLLKTQEPTGGWVYAYQVDGTKVTQEEDSGNIWNIWALFRYGKLTGEQKYLEAAMKGKKWFASKFLANHICRGYWEDVSGGGGRVELSWEAYEFGIAANAFAEMGDQELAVEAAKNAVTWIWTRVIDCRSYFNSYGHAHEQWGWPPATYVAPMFGLAAQTAYRLTGDAFFSRLAGAAKTLGWWTVRETPHGVWPRESTKVDVGGAFWPLEATEFVPVEEPLTVTYWVDWISAQQCTICLRWLIHAINLKSGGKIAVDADSLAGAILGKPGRVMLRPGEVTLHAKHQQINWLGYRTENSRILAIINHEEGTDVKVNFPSLRSSLATVLTSSDSKHWHEETKHMGGPFEVGLPREGCALISWRLQ